MSILPEPGKHSPLWKLWRNAGLGKSDQFFVEHSEAVLELLATDLGPEQVLLSQSRYQRDPDRWDGLAKDSRESRWYLVEDEKLDKLTSVRSTAGLCGLFRPRLANPEQMRSLPFLLMTWEIQDPGNLGTLIRSCAAFTGGGVVVIGGCNPWSSKVARSSAGTVLSTPLVVIEAKLGLDFLDSLKNDEFRCYATVPRGGRSLSEWKPEGKCAVLIGHETRGLPAEVASRSEALTISMNGRLDSLNAGVAGSIVCFQWSSRSLPGREK